MAKKAKRRNKISRLGFLVALLIVTAATIGLLSSFGLLKFGDNQNGDSGQSERTAALEEANSRGLLILVNKENPVDKNYKPDDLTKMKYYAEDRPSYGRYMRKEAAMAFNRLVEGAAKDQIVIRMTTAYRSYDFQKSLFESYASQNGEAAANRFSAKPGESEHQTGLAVDVSSPSVDYQLTKDYGKTEEGQWLQKNAYRYGFILRYPEGKEDITGYQYEPWHLRYVGKFAAKEIFTENVTLEEYLKANPIQ